MWLKILFISLVLVKYSISGIAIAESVGIALEDGSNITASVSFFPQQRQDKLLISLSHPKNCYIYIAEVDTQTNKPSQLFKGITASILQNQKSASVVASLNLLLPKGVDTTIFTKDGGKHNLAIAFDSIKIPTTIVWHKYRPFVINFTYQLQCKNTLITNNVKIGVEAEKVKIIQGEVKKQQVEIIVPTRKKTFHLLQIIVLGVLGGFLINFMPCALPILGMKLQFLTSDRRNILFARTVIFSAFCGIIATFLCFSVGISSIIKLTNGSTTGELVWGVNFQNPMFICILACAVFILWQVHVTSKSCNSCNIWVSKKAMRNGGAVLYGFGSGIINTLLATSCLAPAVTTAILLASHNSGDNMLAFLAIGLGFGLPHLLIILKPKIPLLLQKSKIGQFLHDCVEPFMVITLFWLVYLLTKQIDMLYVLVILFAILIGGYLLKKVLSFMFKLVVIGVVVVVVLVAGTIALNSGDIKGAIEWQPLSEDSIDESILQNKVVLVSIGAEWCISCKINNYRAFNKAEVADFVSSNQIVMMDGDITLSNEVSNEFLRGFGANGVPFNVIFSEKHPSGRVLDTLLSPSYLINELADELRLLRQSNNKKRNGIKAQRIGEDVDFDEETEDCEERVEEDESKSAKKDDIKEDFDKMKDAKNNTKKLPDLKVRKKINH